MEIETKEIALDDARRVTFRAVRPEDGPFLLAVYTSTRLEELALTGWNQAQCDAFIRMQFDAQLLHYGQYYPEGRHLIILVNGDRVGRIYVADVEEEIRILDVTILPQYRGGGIGTPIIKELMGEAAAISKPLTIYVESYNPSLRLFERLGFSKAGDDGYSYLMKWRPDGGR